IVYLHSQEDFDKAWATMKAYFPEQQDILRYLEETYLPPGVMEQWAGCHINKRLNFGQRTTSPVESVNRLLKSYLISGHHTVLQVVKQSFVMAQDMERSIDQATKDQQNRIRYGFLGQDWLGKAPYNVSFKALSMVDKQHLIMLSAVPTKAKPHPQPLKPC
ncbi:hypothetical protein B0T25DRAFT_430655, partial [Lasiosphaeria hispida]